MEVGKSVHARVLDVVKADGIVDLTLRPELLHVTTTEALKSKKEKHKKVLLNKILSPILRQFLYQIYGIRSCLCTFAMLCSSSFRQVQEGGFVGCLRYWLRLYY